MEISKRLKLIKQVGEEITTDEDLKKLLQEKENFVAYDGFEPSGRIHIAQGILRAINVNKMIKAGAKFKMFVADWHGWANNKMGGDLEKIQKVGKYFIEVWKACGMDLDNVDFVWANNMIVDREYWKIVMGVARNSTVNRIIRCGQIMGRDDVKQASQILYPCMQAADIFYLKADICQLGMDQRKVNMLAREVGPKIGFYKPVVVSHHMLMGLKKPTSNESDVVERTIKLKMSKSDPSSAIFMDDSKDEVYEKMKNAWCPEKQAKENPVLEYCKYIVFERFDNFKIKRPDKFGGNVEFASYDELKQAYVEGNIHPLDLKKSTAFYINELLKPVRKHFENNKKAKELAEFVKKQKITR
ncbi:MAG: Tyrosine--tRNA ligase [Candidatus Woesearchaeota archaeon]|nr:Tyrosine--tRNA ligase [Candidatus Woesearchaeota archaeon]